MAIHLQGKLYGAFGMGARESGDSPPPPFSRAMGWPGVVFALIGVSYERIQLKVKHAAGVRMYCSIYNESIVTCSSFKVPAICERSAGFRRGRGKGP